MTWLYKIEKQVQPPPLVN